MINFEQLAGVRVRNTALLRRDCGEEKVGISHSL